VRYDKLDPWKPEVLKGQVSLSERPITLGWLWLLT
jgi:hypothetical protein